MISYELAKQLKEAGFPQNHDLVGGEYGYCNKCNCGDSEYEMSETPCIPTLEELIEACGDDFNNLNYKPQHVNYDDDLVWSTNEHELSTGDSHGKTPSEAVARLWLELNKKNDRS